MSTFKYRHLMASQMNKKELFEKGLNRKPKNYEIVSRAPNHANHLF